MDIFDIYMILYQSFHSLYKKPALQHYSKGRLTGFMIFFQIIYQNILSVSFNLVLVALTYDPKPAQFGMF